MSDELSDEALMSRIQRGDTTHLELLVRRYEKPLFAYAQRILEDRTAAEDAFQETFLRVLRNRASYRTGSTFRPWVYQICLNYCRDLLRKRTRRPEAELKDELPVADPAPGPEEEADRTDTARRVRAAVNALPDKQRDVFLLHYYQHLQYPEIAQALDIPVGTVKSRMFMATRRLSEVLADLRPSEGPREKT